MKQIVRSLAAIICILSCLGGQSIYAANPKKNFGTAAEARDHKFNHQDTPSGNDWHTIYVDTLEVTGHTSERKDSILQPLQVVTNTFGKNWFVFATAGVHSFRGDYSMTSKFKGTLSPDWGIGIGKWFTPGLALKLEFISSDSKGYTEYLTGHYGYGPIMLNKDGYPYRKMKTGWWDISGSVLLNFTRLFLGYEGYNSPKRMNQVMGAFGFGGVHHTGFEHSHGSDNEWSGHIELQYSRFFTRAKRFSLDLKARALLYQTNFDLEYGVYEKVSNKWDTNIGVDLGFTWYMGHKRADGWGNSVTQYYEVDYTGRDILVYRQRDVLVLDSLSQEGKRVNFTFYVFYPNNYSGRNDAPINPESPVNAIDYLLGGVYTQKQYVDNDRVAEILAAGGNPRNEAFTDLPTVSAKERINTNDMPRGYEMECSGSDPSKCMSLSMKPSDRLAFKEATGYLYAPIWDGLHEWGYRIDNETYRQQLLSSANYRDTETYGLNSCKGVQTVRERMNPEEGDYVVSFADVYAALNGYEGYIAEYADKKTVEKLKEVFDKGILQVVEAHGVATSQDNYSGSNASEVGYKRNSDLANYRAETVRTWLMGHDVMKDAQSFVFVDNEVPNSINLVSDASTRGLAAKTNRYVKVRIQAIY